MEERLRKALSGKQKLNDFKDDLTRRVRELEHVKSSGEGEKKSLELSLDGKENEINSLKDKLIVLQKNEEELELRKDEIVEKDAEIESLKTQLRSALILSPEKSDDSKVLYEEKLTNEDGYKQKHENEPESKEENKEVFDTKVNEEEELKREVETDAEPHGENSIDNKGVSMENIEYEEVKTEFTVDVEDKNSVGKKRMPEESKEEVEMEIKDNATETKIITSESEEGEDNGEEEIHNDGSTESEESGNTDDTKQSMDINEGTSQVDDRGEESVNEATTMEEDDTANVNEIEDRLESDRGEVDTEAISTVDSEEIEATAME